MWGCVLNSVLVRVRVHVLVCGRELHYLVGVGDLYERVLRCLLHSLRVLVGVPLLGEPQVRRSNRFRSRVSLHFQHFVEASLSQSERAGEAKQKQRQQLQQLQPRGTHGSSSKAAPDASSRNS